MPVTAYRSDKWSDCNRSFAQTGKWSEATRESGVKCVPQSMTSIPGPAMIRSSRASGLPAGKLGSVGTIP